MQEYRIITNGKKYKAQIRRRFIIFTYWATLQNILEDIQYDSYDKAEKSVIEYMHRLHDAETWWPVDNDSDRFKRQGRPEPDLELMQKY